MSAVSSSGNISLRSICDTDEKLLGKQCVLNTLKGHTAFKYVFMVSLVSAHTYS